MDDNNLSEQNTKESFNKVFVNFEEYILEIRKINNELTILANDNQDEILEKINQYLDENLTVEKLLEIINHRKIKKKNNGASKFAEEFLMKKIKSINQIVEHKVNNFNDETARYINEVERKFAESPGLKFGNNVSSWFVSGITTVENSGALVLFDSHATTKTSILTKFGIYKASAPVLFTRFAEPFSILRSFESFMLIRMLSTGKANLGWKKDLAKQIRKNALEKIIPQVTENNRKLWEETKSTLVIGCDEVSRKSRKSFLELNKDIINKEETKKIDNLIENQYYFFNG